MVSLTSTRRKWLHSFRRHRCQCALNGEKRHAAGTFDHDQALSFHIAPQRRESSSPVFSRTPSNGEGEGALWGQRPGRRSTSRRSPTSRGNA
jgi:hypothetical protein